MIQPETKFYEDLITDFCSIYELGKPPATVVLYDRRQYEEETGDTEMLASYLPARDEVAMSPGVFFVPGVILHELSHHFQALAEGPEEFGRRYDEYLARYGYYGNPYEIAVKEFTKKWWPYFDRLLTARLGTRRPG